MLFLVPARFLADVKQFDPFPPVAGAPFPNPGWHEQGKELNNQVSHDAALRGGVAQARGTVGVRTRGVCGKPGRLSCPYFASAFSGPGQRLVPGPAPVRGCRGLAAPHRGRREYVPVAFPGASIS
jgi:hypothetical protein